jgi:hypothetical protein
MHQVGGREVFAFSPQPIAELNSLLGKIDWTEIVVFTLERLLKRRRLASDIAFVAI